MNKLFSCAFSCIALAMMSGCSTIESDSNAEDETDIGTAAEALVSDQLGYLLADQPGAAWYYPAQAYNSAGAPDYVSRSGVGAYSITYYKLHGSGDGGQGVAHVTAVGQDGAFCKVKSLSQGYNPNVRYVYWTSVEVRCFDPSGAPVDSMFAASFGTYGSWATRQAYALADQPSSGSYTPIMGYQRNTAGGAITVSRSAPGTYSVKIPGMAQQMASSFHPDGGAPVVTAYGSGTARCKVSSWNGSGANELVDVRCTDVLGAPVDSMFEVTFHSKETIFGHTGVPECYFVGDQPAAASYTPAAFYQYTVDKPPITVVRIGAGEYLATAPQRGYPGGIVNVTAMGSDAKHCKIGLWSRTGESGVDESFDVRCVDNAGAPADSAFALSFAAYP